MQAIKVPTTNGIDDIKLIGETDLERQFIKQLAESGTLSCISRHVGDSILFRPISVSPDLSSYTSVADKTIGKYNFYVRQNQDKLINLTFKTDGNPLDLSGYTGIYLQVKYRKGAPAVFGVSLGSGLTVTGDDNTILEVKFSAAQTAMLTCESYYYDVLMTAPTSNVYHLEGKITVKNTSTR